MTDRDPATADDAAAAPATARPLPPTAHHGMACRNCGHTQPLGLSLRLSGLFRAARGDVRPGGRRGDVHARGHRAASTRASGAISSCCRSTRSPARSLPVGSTPLARRRPPGARRSASSGCGSRTTPATRRCRFKDRPVGDRRGPRRGVRRRRPSPAPRPATSPAPRRPPRPRSGSGLRLHPGRPRARQGRSRARLRRDGRPDRRAPTTTSTASAWRSRTRPAGAS